MTWEIAKSIADFLMSLPVVEDSVFFDFIGGEPLLEIDLISKISDYIVCQLQLQNHPWANSYHFRFTTNGLLYSSDKVQRYITKYKDHLSIQISLDGTKQKHDLNRVFVNGSGSYEKLLPNVQLWIKQFEEEATSFMVISHEDLPYLSESVIHLIMLGIKDMNPLEKVALRVKHSALSETISEFCRLIKISSKESLSTPNCHI